MTEEELLEQLAYYKRQANYCLDWAREHTQEGNLEQSHLWAERALGTVGNYVRVLQRLEDNGQQ